MKTEKQTIIMGSIYALLYLLIAMATQNWHNERYPRTNEAIAGAAAGGGPSASAGLAWPAYWVYKVVDVLVCPEPAE